MSKILTHMEIEEVWVEHGLDECGIHRFTRAIESAILSKLNSAESAIVNACMEVESCLDKDPCVSMRNLKEYWFTAGLNEMAVPNEDLQRRLESAERKVIEQAAVIDRMGEQITYMKTALIAACKFYEAHGETETLSHATVKQTLATPTDSKQILAEWLDKQLGEPVTTIMLLDDAGSQINMTLQTPLFKKPGVLK